MNWGRNVTLGVVCWILSPAFGANAADWPGFLGGPYRTNCSADRGLLQEWPKDGPPLAWDVRGLGHSYGGVIVVGERVFACGGNRLTALSLANGTILWQTPASTGHGTPAYIDGRIVVVGGHGEVSCHDSADGKTLWSGKVSAALKADNDYIEKPIGRPDKGGGWEQSPAVFDGMVVIAYGQVDAVVVALDLKTGKLRWRAKGTGKAVGKSFASCLLVEHGGRKTLIATTTYALTGIDPASGKVLWEQPVQEGTQYGLVNTPVFAAGYVYIAEGYTDKQKVLCTTLKLGREGTTVESTSAVGCIRPCQENFVTTKGMVFGGTAFGRDDIPKGSESKLLIDGNTPTKESLELVGKKKWRVLAVACQDLVTGEALGVSTAVPTGGHSRQLLTWADGRLYAHSSGDYEDVFLLDATPSMTVRGVLHVSPATPPLPRDHWGAMAAFANPVVAGGRLLLRQRDRLLAYDVRIHALRMGRHQ